MGVFHFFMLWAEIGALSITGDCTKAMYYFNTVQKNWNLSLLECPLINIHKSLSFMENSYDSYDFVTPQNRLSVLVTPASLVPFNARLAVCCSGNTLIACLLFSNRNVVLLRSDSKGEILRCIRIVDTKAQEGATINQLCYITNYQ